MKLALVGFVLRRVRTSMWRLFWTHVLTAGTVAMTLFVFGGFMLLETNLQGMLVAWGDQIQVSAYLKSDASASEIDSLLQRVERFAEVERVRRITREQAWRDFQVALGSQSGLLEGLPREVLPASLEITLHTAHRRTAAIELVARRLEAEPAIALVEYPQEWVERLGLVVLLLEWLKWILAGVLFLATFFIVGSMVKLAVFARREEVEVLQLVGASEGLVQAPFVIEGTIQGFAGGVLALVGLAAGYLLLERELAPLAAVFSPLGRIRFLDPHAMVMLVGIGCFLGVSGSLISLRSVIRSWHSARA
jgi:cell division transport system permease protein